MERGKGFVLEFKRFSCLQRQDLYNLHKPSLLHFFIQVQSCVLPCGESLATRFLLPLLVYRWVQ
jgi:hypothetical protein